MLISLNQELFNQKKHLSFSFIKGPVMDIIEHTPVITHLSGQVYLSTMDAVNALKDN
jgi:SulP family sulfate permease